MKLQSNSSIRTALSAMDKVEVKQGKSTKHATSEPNFGFFGVDELNDLDDITPIEEK